MMYSHVRKNSLLHTPIYGNPIIIKRDDQTQMEITATSESTSNSKEDKHSPLIPEDDGESGLPTCKFHSVTFYVGRIWDVLFFQWVEISSHFAQIIYIKIIKPNKGLHISLRLINLSAGLAIISYSQTYM